MRGGLLMQTLMTINRISWPKYCLFARRDVDLLGRFYVITMVMLRCGIKLYGDVSIFVHVTNTIFLYFLFYLGWFVYYLYLWWENCMPRLSCLVITTCRITNMFNYTYSHFTYFHDTTTSKRFCFQAKSLNGRILVLQSCVFLMGIEPTTSEFIHTSTWIIRMHVKIYGDLPISQVIQM